MESVYITTCINTEKNSYDLRRCENRCEALNSSCEEQEAVRSNILFCLLVEGHKFERERQFMAEKNQNISSQEVPPPIKIQQASPNQKKIPLESLHGINLSNYPCLMK